MPVDERSRHQLYRKLDELMGAQEATTLMELLPPSGWGDVARRQDLEALRLATRQDIEALRLELHADMERLARRVIMWTSSIVVTGVGLAFAAGSLAF
jgi:hypothetical protein